MTQFDLGMGFGLAFAAVGFGKWLPYVATRELTWLDVAITPVVYFLVIMAYRKLQGRRSA